MKRMMMAGSMLGFGMGIALGLAQGSSWAAIIWRSSAMACVSGFLFRWWSGIWVKSFQQVQAERCAAPEQSNASSTAVTPIKS
jgi:hypothetical protein